jgi:hypothetical protein
VGTCGPAGNSNTDAAGIRVSGPAHRSAYRQQPKADVRDDVTRHNESSDLREQRRLVVEEFRQRAGGRRAEHRRNPG